MARKLSFDTSIVADIKSAASDSFKDNIEMIEINKIKPSGDNFYSISDLDMLADDIEREGLKHNLVVSEDIDAPGTYILKSGHRRFAAIQKLVKENRYTGKYLPCLVDGKKSKDECFLDLIMLNATTRVMTDAEIFKQYDALKEVLERFKENGDDRFNGRMRDRIAEALNVSKSQVGKIENIKHNASKNVKEAVENGDLSISTANEIARLDKKEQSRIENFGSVQHKDVKKKTDGKKKTDAKKTKESPVEKEINELFPEKYADALKGIVMIAAEQENYTEAQKNALVGRIIRILKKVNIQEAEEKASGKKRKK